MEQFLKGFRNFTEVIFKKIPVQPSIVWVIVIVIIYLIYRILTKALEQMLMKASRGDIERVKSGVKIWRFLYWVIAAVLLLAGTGGNLAALGLSAAFLGMVLGWSLQRPVTGIAAWFLVTLMKPFKIGDRVIVAGVIGDVKEIGIMYVTMEQVGGTIGGEEKSGRAVLIPTAVLFDQVIFNYTMRESEVQESKYILDEIIIRMSYDADWSAAEKIFISAAREITKDIVEEIGKEPFIRAEFIDWGVYVRLRYYTRPVERQEISTNITKIIFHKVAESKNVKFAYPHSEAEITYIAKDSKDIPFHPGQSK